VLPRALVALATNRVSSVDIEGCRRYVGAVGADLSMWVYPPGGDVRRGQYTSASVRERLYCRPATDVHGPMAGVLIYTAASDSEGTLGGLVQLGQPVTLGRQIQCALKAMRICGSDPLCSEHSPTGDGRSVHGACCHACLFAPETSCERGNRFLDRPP